MTTLSNINQYGTGFQIKVLSALLQDTVFLKTVYDVLSDEYFDNQGIKWIINEILKYYKEYNCNISIDALKVELKKLDNEVLQLSIKEQLKLSYNASTEDSEYVKKEFLGFCKNQQLKKAISKSVDLLKTSDYDTIRQLINNALKAGVEKDIGLEYNKDIELRYREDDRNPIPFPWDTFNKITQGGYGKGDLVLIFGNPKGGKSWSVVAMAAHAAKLGYNVVYYALELGQTYVGKRIDANLTNIPVDQIDKHKKEVEHLMKNLPGNIIVKSYPPKRASLDTIETHLNHLKDDLGFVPDAVFIDYLDLLRNRNSRKERKDDIDDVYTDAKGLAKELNIPIISPSQANRSGAEQDILESTHIAGSFDKIMIGDIIISLARGRKDRLNKTGRWHIMGNRYGVDGVTYNSIIDTSTGYIEIDEEELDLDKIQEENKKNTKKGDFNDSEREFLKNKFFELEKNL